MYIIHFKIDNDIFIAMLNYITLLFAVILNLCQIQPTNT